VEHGVTEEATGIDLVQQQLRVAMGEPLSFRQEDIRFLHHALECRINAEDPEKNFAPGPGRIGFYHAPGGHGVRVDSHVYGGYEISPHYDSLVGKLLCTGATRPAAIRRMECALAELRLEGIATTAPFLEKILRDEDFRAGRVTTHFLQNFLQRDRGV